MRECARRRGMRSSAHHLVDEGDTFWEIAANNGVSVQTLRRHNPDLDPAWLQPGDRVRLPSAWHRTNVGPRASPVMTEEAESSDSEDEAEGDWPAAGSARERALLHRRAARDHTNVPPLLVAAAAAFALGATVGMMCIFCLASIFS